MANNTASLAPERAIDYKEMYLSHLSDEDRDHVMKCIMLSQAEGKRVTLRELLKVFQQTKRTPFDIYMQRELALIKNYITACCFSYKIHYQSSK